jgi:hypothetical protein
MHQIAVVVPFIFILCTLILGWLRGLFAFVLFLVVAAWGVLLPRPVAKLTTEDPSALLIDFHSHTAASHDGRPGFTATKNIDWHRAQGFNAGFITDHNVVTASLEGKQISMQHWPTETYRSLQGQEISLWKTHLVVLGNHDVIDNRPYDSDPTRVPVFVSEIKDRGLPLIASLPEYWFYRWETPVVNNVIASKKLPGIDVPPPPPALMKATLPSPVKAEAAGTPAIGSINDLVKWGIAGFEIVNSAPKALDFPIEYRRKIGDLCKANNLFVTGISDTHGYGSATAVWNVMRIPGWDQLNADQLEAAVLKDLRTRRFDAVNVLERVRYNPSTRWKILLTPLMTAGFWWRGLKPLECLSWIFWIWLLCGVLGKESRRELPHG